MKKVNDLPSKLRNDLRGTIHDEKPGKHALGQSTWRYEDGRFLVYGGDSLIERICYILLSEVKWGEVDIVDYAPYPKANYSGEVWITIEKEHVIPLGSTTKLIHIDKTGNLFISNSSLQIKQFREIMQPYANSIKNTDLDIIHKKLWAFSK